MSPIRVNNLTSAFSERITIEKSIETTDAKGTVESNYIKYKDTWANVFFTSIATTHAEHFDNESRSVIFTIRHDKEVTRDSRILYNGDYYSIESIEPQERKRYMRIITSLMVR